MNGIKAPIGTGPWILQESKLNQYDVFVRNENYWGEKPAIKKITFNVIPDPTTRAVAFETGDIDLLYGNEGLLPLDTFARFSQNPAYHTQLSQPIETVMLALNTAKAPTNELAVREALNYAVNKKSLIDNALYGTQQVADTLFAPSVPYANLGLKPSQYDPQKAKALLEKAGWTLPAGKDIREKNGQPLRIELSFIGTDALSKSMAEIIQADMRQIGADVSLIGEEESSIYARQRDGRFGMIFHRTWGAPYDPHAFLSSMRVPSHADFQAQQGLADKPLIDKEIGEVLATHDETQRQALYRDILTRLHDEAVYLPISYISMMVVSKPELGNIPSAPIATEIPFEQIPSVQKQLIRKGYQAGKQVITATQMLESMITNPRPTRAEITDVANAIYDGTSAIMLSGETAAGAFPVEVVRTMDLIARTTEDDIDYKGMHSASRTKKNDDIANAIAHATVTTAHDLDAAAILTVTMSGVTAREISKYRPFCPIISCTVSERVQRQMNLSWGVYPVLVDEVSNTDGLFDSALHAAIQTDMVNRGDIVVITAGAPVGVSNTTNMMKVERI